MSLDPSAPIVLTKSVLKELVVIEDVGCDPPFNGLLFQYSTRLSSVYRTDETVFVEFLIVTLFVNKLGSIASDAYIGFVKYIVSLGLNEPIELTKIVL